MMIKKIFVALVATALTTFALASPASAHITVNPKTADKGSYGKLTFRVPNEKDNASTTKVEITIPTDKPITAVSVQPHAGWTYAVEKAKLPTPVQSHGHEIAEAVSKVTFSAQDGVGVKPGEFEEFNISAGPLPKDADSLVFKALQTYSNGEIVRWIDTPVAGEEAEHPAPVLTLTAPAAASKPAVSQSDVDTARNLGIGGLVVGLLGLVAAIGAFATRRRS